MLWVYIDNLHMLTFMIKGKKTREDGEWMTVYSGHNETDNRMELVSPTTFYNIKCIYKQFFFFFLKVSLINKFIVSVAMV